MSGLELGVTVPGRVSVAAVAERGQVVGVIGPNGAGKSSLLRAVAGLVPSRGEVRVADAIWSGLPVRERAVGMAFQDRLLFPHLSALDNVAFGPRTAGASRRDAHRKAQEWLDRFGVGELARRKPRQLSGGQAQRVSIARALAADPRVLLLDEPFAGLDVGVAASLRVELARHLAAYDGVTLLVTHDAIDALTLADVVWVLEAGELVQVGPPREVAARPLTRHVARLVGLNVLTEGERFYSFSPSAVTVSPAEPAGSARPRWPGTVTSLAPHGDAVRLLVSGDHELLADVTPAAVAELELAPGRQVWLSVKETAVDSYDAPTNGEGRGEGRSEGKGESDGESSGA
jgi:molybdate transport system ATP-binding protein